MKLISCDINNFGKFTNRHFDFGEGCNVICEDNGWGKSTLAAFIRVMFYGFEKIKGSTEINSERAKFEPWQGGVYGGKIIFEAGGHKYILSRTFGQKEKDDKFSLRDYETKLESGTFSSDIGEELFKLDSKSFIRTVFISQNDCDTQVTDRINAKLGNLSEDTEDINNFEKVDAKFKNIINKMSPTHKKGSINELKNKIAKLEQEVRLGQIIDKNIKESLEYRNREQERYNELKLKQSRLQSERADLSKLKDSQVIREKYIHVTEEYNEWEKKCSEERAFFGGEIPKEEDIDRYLNQLNELNNHASEVVRCQLSDSESEKLNTYKQMFINEAPTFEQIDEYIAKWKHRLDKKIPLMVAGSALLLTGVGVCFIRRLAGMLLISAGVIILFFVAVLFALNKTKKQICEFLGKYGYKENTSDIVNTLMGIKSDIKEYAKLLEKEKEVELLINDYEIKMIRREIDLFIGKYYNKSSFDLSEITIKLVEMKMRLQLYKECCREAEWRDLSRKNIEAQYDMNELMNIETDLVSIEELDEQINSISDELERLHKKIFEYNGKIDSLQNEREEIFEAAEHLNELIEQLEKEQKKYFLITKARELLGNAKLSFTQKYMMPLTKGFNKYYSILTGKNADEYIIDANGDIKIDEMGLPRSTEYLSTGCKDLTGICMRMALVDSMYREEKPFVIFDDPFVNLDEEKLRGGMKLLEDISGEYQVIYFTCHKSRMI